ncbi:hypothetical protein AAOGI_08920 [Agarivorans albus]
MEHDFSWLIMPTCTQKFFSDFWQKKPSVLCSNRENHYQGLFDMGALESLIEYSQPKPPSIRIVKAQPKDEISVPYYPNGRINIDKVRQYYMNGYTVILNSVENYNAKVSQLTRAIENQLRSRVQVNCYLTPASSQGFRPHYDTHDVFVAQIEGEKCWKVYSEELACPLNRMYDGEAVLKEAVDPSREVRLKPGDLLYIPRGWIHEAATLDEASLHITISLHPPLAVDLLYSVIEELIAKYPQFRQAMPIGSISERPSTKATREQFNNLLNILKNEAELDGALDRIEGEIIARGRSGGDGRAFYDANEINNIQPSTKLIRRYHLPCRIISLSDTEIGLRFLGALIKGPNSFEDAMNFVINQVSSFYVADIPNLPEEHQCVFAMSLVKDGLCTIET